MGDGASIRNGTPAVAEYSKCVRIAGGQAGGADPVQTRDMFPLTVAAAVVTRVAAAIVDTVLLAANPNRFGAIICNGASSNLYVKYGAGASLVAGAESYTVKIPPGQTWELVGQALYTGAINGIWDAADANGEALVTEIA